MQIILQYKIFHVETNEALINNSMHFILFFTLLFLLQPLPNFQTIWTVYK